MDVIESGLQQLPNDTQLLATLAELQIQQRQWPQATAAMDQLDEIIRVLRRVPVSPDEHRQLNLRQAELGLLRARWYLAGDNPDRQISKADRFVERVLSDPVPLDLSSKVFQDLGVLCAQLGRWEDAAEVFHNATTAAPLAVSARLQLVTALARVGRFAEAAAECRQLTDRPLHPQYALDVWLQYTRLLLELELSKPSGDRLWDDFDKALAQLKRVGGQLPEVQLLELDAQNVRQSSPEQAAAERARAMEVQFGSSATFWRGALDFYLRWDLAGDAQAPLRGCSSWATKRRPVLPAYLRPCRQTRPPRCPATRSLARPRWPTM